jgi:sporulation protein YtfJ
MFDKRRKEETMDGKNALNEFVSSAMDKVREMADTNTIVGQPINTVDGVTLIPISKVSFGFGGGGGDYGKPTKDSFGGGAATGVKIDPVAFLVIKDGSTRVLPVAVPPATTVDRVIDMVPDILDKVETFFDKKEEKEAL